MKTPQELFDAVKEFIIKEQSNENWTVYKMDVPKEEHIDIIMLKWKGKKEFDKLVKEYIWSVATK